MRIARKLFALAIMAMAVMALAASTAAAQGPGGPTVEIRTEPGNLHIAQNIPVHAEGEVTLFGHVFGVEALASDCHLEFEGNLNEDGEGFVTAATFSDHPDPNCNRVPCDTDGNGAIDPWPVHIDYVPAVDDTVLWAEFCILPDTGGSVNRCEVAKAITTGPGGAHDYEVDYEQPPAETAGTPHAGPRCELQDEVHLETDPTHPGFEIRNENH